MIWKNIPCAPDYEINEFGVVRRLIHSRSNATKIGRISKPFINKGDKYLRLILTVDGRPRHFLINRLVALCFHGAPPFAKAEATHKDGNPGNNYWENLMWDTHLGNMRQMIKHGNSAKGTKNPNVVLNEYQVSKIKRAHVLGAKVADQARSYKVNYATIWCIVNKKSWRYVA